MKASVKKKAVILPVILAATQVALVIMRKDKHPDLQINLPFLIVGALALCGAGFWLGYSRRMRGFRIRNFGQRIRLIGEALALTSGLAIVNRLADLWIYHGNGVGLTAIFGVFSVVAGISLADEARKARASDLHFEDGTGKSALVCEPEDAIRRAIKEALSRQGYVVTTCKSASEAHLKAMDGAYDLVVCDGASPEVEALRARLAGASGSEHADWQLLNLST